MCNLVFLPDTPRRWCDLAGGRRRVSVLLSFARTEYRFLEVCGKRAIYSW